MGTKILRKQKIREDKFKEFKKHIFNSLIFYSHGFRATNRKFALIKDTK